MDRPVAIVSTGTQKEGEEEAAGHYLLWKSDGPPSERPSLAPGYRASLWVAGRGRLWPSGLSQARTRLRFAMRDLFQRLGCFASRECGAVCIRDASGSVVHYSAYTGRYWRFNFLAERDLQIGDTWTNPDHRGRGLALYAIDRILRMKAAPGRQFWYCVEAINRPSLRVVEKAGFKPAGAAIWYKPYGVQFLGSYVPMEGTPSLTGAGDAADPCQKFGTSP